MRLVYQRSIYLSIYLSINSLPSSFGGAPSEMARMLTSEDTANIRNMLQDPDAGGDVLFWLYATVAYAVLRVTA